jgi:ABC-type bacteriocin/lantibiotic exporter with double-glycine peptidase domain
MIRKCSRLLGYFRPDRAAFLICIAAGLVEEAISLLIPWAWKALIDEVFAKKQAGLLLPVIGALLASAIVFVTSDLVHDYALAQTVERVGAALSGSLFARILSLDYAYVQTRQTGRLMALFTSDISKVAGMYSRILRDGIVQFAGLLATLLVLFLVDWRLTLLAAASLPFFVFMPLVFSRRIGEASRHRMAGPAACGIAHGTSGNSGGR